MDKLDIDRARSKVMNHITGEDGPLSGLNGKPYYAIEDAVHEGLKEATEEVCICCQQKPKRVEMKSKSRGLTASVAILSVLTQEGTRICWECFCQKVLE